MSFCGFFSHKSEIGGRQIRQECLFCDANRSGPLDEG